MYNHPVSNVWPLRLLPGQDLKSEIEHFAAVHTIRAGIVLSGIGSLDTALIRFANQPAGEKLSGYLEILSLSGSVSVHGVHLHLCVADENGNVKGGHLLAGCTIYTTAEIVIAELEGYEFKREADTNTGYNELVIVKC